MKREVASAIAAVLLTAIAAAAQQPAAEAPAQAQADEPIWRFRWEGHPSLFVGDDVRLEGDGSGTDKASEWVGDRHNLRRVSQIAPPRGNRCH